LQALGWAERAVRLRYPCCWLCGWGEWRADLAELLGEVAREGLDNRLGGVVHSERGIDTQDVHAALFQDRFREVVHLMSTLDERPHLGGRLP